MTPARCPVRWAALSPVTQTPALAIRGMRKSFGPNLAVRDVDLDVEPGAFLGLVGPNGAGKTTLLSMAVGLLRPDQGNAWVAGNPVWPASGADQAKQLLGVLPVWLGHLAVTRLAGRQVAILHTLAGPA